MWSCQAYYPLPPTPNHSPTLALLYLHHHVSLLPPKSQPPHHPAHCPCLSSWPLCSSPHCHPNQPNNNGSREEDHPAAHATSACHNPASVPGAIYKECLLVLRLAPSSDQWHMNTLSNMHWPDLLLEACLAGHS